MGDSGIPRRPFIIGVMGGHDSDPETMSEALQLGEEIAKRGYIVLTGGGPGAMRAASEGAHRAGGLVIGILPNDRKRPLAGYPNEFVDIPIYTGMFDARNVINAKTPHVLIALRGGAGTLSEIALAIKAGTPVICLHSPGIIHSMASDVTVLETVEAVMDTMDKILAARRENDFTDDLR
jgi:uncharacterized protein (TIGR00725 family)